MAEVDQLVNSLLSDDAVYFAILGPGGIGKTSVALAAMHHPSVKAKYQSRRYFIACDAADTVDALNDLLAERLHLSPKRAIAHLSSIVKSSGGIPFLITLDNFETPWEKLGGRQPVENLLSELTDIPNLSLIVTLRGADKPYGIMWTRPMLPPLKPLGLEAAKKAFLAQADVPEDDPYLEPLMDAVDRMPLAVTLIAALARYTKCEDLYKRWEVEKTAMVTQDSQERLSNLDVSIEVSLRSPRFQSNPSAMALLQLLALFPNGETAAFLQSMHESNFPLQMALDTLLRVCLMYEQNGYYKLLAPIREYMMKYHPVNPVALRRAASHYLLKLQEWFSIHLTTQGNLAGAELLPHAANMRVVFYTVSNSPDAPGSMILGIGLPLDFMFGSWLSKAISFEINEVAIASVTGRPDCKFEEAVFISRRRDEANLLHGIALLETFGAKGNVYRVNALAGLANHYASVGRLHDALIASNEASRLVMLDETHATTATQLHTRVTEAGMFLMNGKSARATEIVDDVLKEAEPLGLSPITRDCHDMLSRICRTRGLYQRALYHADLSVDKDEAHLTFEAARFLFTVFGTMRVLSQNSNAERFGLSAINAWAELDRPAWVTSTQSQLGLLYLEQGRLDQALVLVLKSAEYWKEDPSTNEMLFQVYFARQDFQEARRQLDVALKLHQQAKEPFKNRYLICLGDYNMRLGAHEDALNQFVTSCIICSCRMPSRLRLSMSLTRLGDVLWKMGDNLTAQSCYVAALDLIKYLGLVRHQADLLYRLGLLELVRNTGVESVRKALTAFIRTAYLFEKAEIPYGIQIALNMVAFCQDAQVAEVNFRPIISPNSLLISVSTGISRP
jgi:tetratricopeptide (TPR) repeat protein